MRYSNTAVEQFHLGRLVDGIEQGRIGIPEFQRDFDWNENDIRSLLATVFSGWPAGSLLLLAGDSPIFKLRPMEGAPPLGKITFGVLDGQQRLTSLYQALYGKGEARFAIKWDVADDQEIDEAIMSVRKRNWERHYNSVDQQIERRIIPLTALKSATDFFNWRDRILAKISDPVRVSRVRNLVTDLYTYRLSAIHDYEFPVVKLDSEIEPSAISRIFEKVNKTGLTLNTFDLVVAKSFDANWNLRDKWLEAQESFPVLNSFFGDDGLPLLQAISLMRRSDLRQAAVLDLSKQDVQGSWNAAIEAAVRVIGFLRTDCGVLKRELLPYPNMLSPLIALEERGLITGDRTTYSSWFWNSGFVGLYDAAANTRLVAHYKAFLNGNKRGFQTDDEARFVSLFGTTKKNQRALWATANCAYAIALEQSVGSLSDELLAELEISTLFSRMEIESVTGPALMDDADAQYRGCINSIFVPKRLTGIVAKVGAEESLMVCGRSEFSTYTYAQIPNGGLGYLGDWDAFRAFRNDWLIEFMKSRYVTNLMVVKAEPARDEFRLEKL